MPKIIQHLRADRAGWAQQDIIPKEGELALLCIEGGTLIKIGDGTQPFSALSSLTGEVKSGTGEQATLRHGDDLRFSQATALSVFFPDFIREDYYASLSFDSPADMPTALSYPASPHIYFSGDDVADGIFVPNVNKHYTILFWHDGRMQALARGVTLDS